MDYLDGEGRVGRGVGLVHEGVVGEHHHVGLDLLRHALGPGLRHVEPHGLRADGRGGEQQGRRGG